MIDRLVLASISSERVNRIAKWVILGEPKPADLSDAESLLWDDISAEVAAQPGVAWDWTNEDV